MAKRGRRSGHARRSGVKNNVWTSLILNEVLVATGNTTVASIVNSADWSNLLSGERATVLTIRGWLSISAEVDTVTKSEGQIFWYIAVNDSLIATAAIPPADLVSTYTQTNILTTGGFIASSILGGVGGLAAAREMTWEIDVKTMRTIRSGDNVDLVATNGTGDDIRVGGVFRALLRKGGN